MIRVIVVGAVLALIHLLLYRRLVRATALSAVPARGAVVVLALLWLLALIGLGSGVSLDPAWSRLPAWWGLTWLAAMFYVLLGLLATGVVLLIGRLARVAVASPKDPRRPKVLRAVYAVVVLAAVAVTGYGTFEARQVRVVNAQATLPGLPEQFDGLRVAIVADLHVGPSRGAEFTQQVVDLVNEQRPDLVVMPGDLIDGTVARVGGDLAPLAELDTPYGVFGAAGNHEGYADDVDAWLDHWESLGVTTLRNSRVEIERDGAYIDIAGVYDFSTGAPYDPDLPQTLEGKADDRFVLLIAHQPEQVLEASELGVDLQASGHTHGGQMWPVSTFVGLLNPTVRGLDQFADTRIYTTVGAGTWGPPVRVGVQPEIVILELNRG